SEKIIGEALSGVSSAGSPGSSGMTHISQNGSCASLRDKVFLATKVFPLVPLAPIVEQRAVASARRLQTDRIDLYQVHWPNPVFPLASTMSGMRKLVDQGTVVNVGVSNFPLARWQEAERFFRGPVLTNQVRYNLVDRRPEAELLPWAQANQRIVIAYSPLAQGFLSAKYGPGNRPKGAARAGNPLFLEENLQRGVTMFEVLRNIAKSHDATPSQVALAWLVRHPNVVVIPGASSVEQLERNAAAADLELTDQDDYSLREASDAFIPSGGVKTLPKMIRARLGL
ncbi:MAG TPA: aldo/keto reductase, partial [Acidimicrobiales bacterium]|nr:aldo/keto reductase [Acidimicrobiales bacterium]